MQAVEKIEKDKVGTGRKQPKTVEVKRQMEESLKEAKQQLLEAKSLLR